MQESMAKQTNIQMPARKLRRVINEVRGKSVLEAARILKFMPYFAARVVEQNLIAAIANANEKFGASASDLKVSEIFAGSGKNLQKAKAYFSFDS